MMATFIKQHLSNIWSSIDENVKQHWDWAENSFACNKKWVYLDFLYIYIDKLFTVKESLILFILLSSIVV